MEQIFPAYLQHISVNKFFFSYCRTLLYHSELYNGTILHSHPFFMGMDRSRQYYGIYLETKGSPLQMEVMPGYETK